MPEINLYELSLIELEELLFQSRLEAKYFIKTNNPELFKRINELENHIYLRNLDGPIQTEIGL